MICSPSTVPLIESGDVTINEDGGIAVVNVRLLNEIENDFVLDYSTGEVPDGADGRYTHIQTALSFTTRFNRGR